MGNYNCYYLGPYVKVSPPEVTYTENILTCTNFECECHGKYVSDSKFCKLCGHPVRVSPVSRKRQLSMHDFLEAEFNDCDLFSVVHLEDKDYQILISNKKGQGGVHIEKWGEYPVPAGTSFFSHVDWVRLIAKLKEIGYKFEAKVGAVFYYN
jgi:hypothetical protein